MRNNFIFLLFLLIYTSSFGKNERIEVTSYNYIIDSIIKYGQFSKVIFNIDKNSEYCIKYEYDTTQIPINLLLGDDRWNKLMLINDSIHSAYKTNIKYNTIFKNTICFNFNKKHKGTCKKRIKNCDSKLSIYLKIYESIKINNLSYVFAFISSDKSFYNVKVLIIFDRYGKIIKHGTIGGIY